MMSFVTSLIFHKAFKWGLTSLIILLSVVYITRIFASGDKPHTHLPLYQIPLTTVQGNPFTLQKYQGKVILLVNVASRCGFTPQYEDLEALYQRFKKQGLVVIGLPCNDFLGQEPGTEDDILTFCQTKYNVTFPLTSKVHTIGKGKHPLYAFLTDKTANPSFGGPISWNFNKFVIGRDGTVLKRYPSRVSPRSKDFLSDMTQFLSQK